MEKNRVCQYCGKEQTLENYSKDKTGKDGLQSYCKSCKKTINQRHRDRYRANYNPQDIPNEKTCGKCKVKKSVKENFSLNKISPDGVNSLCKDCVLHYKEENYEHIACLAAKRRAMEKKLPFNLEDKDIVVPDYCPILGIKLEKIQGRGLGNRNNAPSVDRINPALGYIKGNVRVISFRANTLKNNATSEELQKVLTDLRNYEIFSHL